MSHHKEKSPQAIIFDFDGTMADTGAIIRTIYNKMARESGWAHMALDDYNQLRKGSFGHARRWAGIRWWQYPKALSAGRKLMRLESQKVKLFAGIPELIRELDDNGVDVYILSRNLPDTIAAVLKRYKLENRAEILSYKALLIGSKRAVIAKLLIKQRYRNRRVWMIGDETRDIRAARSARTKSIAVTWGLQDIEVLRRCHPTEEASSVKALHDILMQKVKSTHR